MVRKKTEVPPLDIFGVTDVARYLRVSRGWVYAHLAEIPHRRVGAKIIFLRRAIEEWIVNPIANPLRKEEEASRFAEQKIAEILNCKR
jgi:hypothetical protein